MGTNGTGNNDSTTGTAGNDKIYGKGGDDKLMGGRGDDILFGGRGNDILVGGKGNDSLYGGGTRDIPEVDILQGGQGNDLYVLGNTKQSFYVGDFDAGFADIRTFNVLEDTLRLHGSVSDYSFGISGNSTRISFRGDLVGVVKGVTDIQGLIDATDFVGGSTPETV